jgi:hypothetical protein
MLSGRYDFWLVVVSVTYGWQLPAHIPVGAVVAA